MQKRIFAYNISFITDAVSDGATKKHYYFFLILNLPIGRDFDLSFIRGHHHLSEYMDISRPAEYFIACYTVLTRPNKVETAAHGCNSWLSVKVHLTPKYFFRLKKSSHLFGTHCAFFSLFSPNLDFLQAVKVTKSSHHLLHDRASKGYGSIPG